MKLRKEVRCLYTRIVTLAGLVVCVLPIGCSQQPASFGVRNTSEFRLKDVVLENQAGEKLSMGWLSHDKSKWHMVPGWQTPESITLKGVVDASDQEFEFAQDMIALGRSEKYLFIIEPSRSEKSGLTFKVDTSPQE